MWGWRVCAGAKSRAGGRVTLPVGIQSGTPVDGMFWQHNGSETQDGPIQSAVGLRVSPLLPGGRSARGAAHSLVGRGARVGTAAGDILAADPLARSRDALRVHRRGDRGVSAYRGAELDGRTGICRMASHVARGSMGSRPSRSSNGIAVAVAGRGS